MSCDWLVGEQEDGRVQLYACCGSCGAKLPVSDGKQARAVLDWHALSDHCAAVQRLADARVA